MLHAAAFASREGSGFSCLKRRKGETVAYLVTIDKYVPDEPDSRVDLELSGEVEAIGPAAFRFSNEVRTVRATEVLHAIGDNAFDGCRNLVEASFPGQVERLGKRAFQHCTSLREISFSDALAIVEDAAFQGCTSLSSASFPGVVAVERYAFQRCTDLREVAWGRIESLGRRAFANCTALEKVEFPVSLRSIGEEAFSGCASLAEISFEDGGAAIEEIGPRAFRGCASLDPACVPAALVERFPEAFPQAIAAKCGIVVKEGRSRLEAEFARRHEADREELLADGRAFRERARDIRERIDAAGVFAHAERSRLQAELDDVESQLAEVSELIEALDNPIDADLLSCMDE